MSCSLVMAGLVPAIHDFVRGWLSEIRHARHKAGHDEFSQEAKSAIEAA
jgi:hypothetical protein